MPTVTVVRTVSPYGWAVECSRCGLIPCVWGHPYTAAWDAMGHAAVHAGASIRP